MRTLLSLLCFLFIATCVSCDLRSGIAKKNMEKYTLTPTPAFPAIAPDESVDPADIVEVDTAVEGELVSINGHRQQTSAECTKFNRLMVNGDSNVIKIKGPCRQIMVNGDGNQVTADAAIQFVFNGSENVLKYSRVVNGKRPAVVESKRGNVIEKVPAPSS